MFCVIFLFIVSFWEHTKNTWLTVDIFAILLWILGGEPTYHFKTLVPAVASGAIIGKGGETIAALQKDAGARVKMSKSHDFYPGEFDFFL